MTMMDRRALVGALAAVGATPALAQTESATRLDVDASVMREALQLPGVFRVGARNGSATIVEFFDYNCPWCKQSARDLDALLKSDSRLKLILVNYAVLGIPSILAGKVALGVAFEAAESYPAFHRELLAARGAVGGDEALAVAQKLNLDIDSITERANSDVVTAALKASADFGARNNLAATPSYLIGRHAYVGHVPMAQMKSIIASERA